MLIYISVVYDSMDITKIVADAASIALDTVPAGGSEYTDAILGIFVSNPEQHFKGSQIKELFADQGVEIKNPSNVLFGLMKQGKLKRPKSSWYILA